MSSFCAWANCVFFGVSEDGAVAWHSGPEYQLLHNAGHPDGQAAITAAGSNYAVHPPIEDMTNPVGEWNRSRLRVNRGHLAFGRERNGGAGESIHELLARLGRRFGHVWAFISNESASRRRRGADSRVSKRSSVCRDGTLRRSLAPNRASSQARGAMQDTRAVGLPATSLSHVGRTCCGWGAATSGRYRFT